MSAVGAIEPGWLAAELGEEFPGLRLKTLLVGRGSGRSPAEVKRRLRDLGSRVSGPQAINLRHQQIPWAYRVFYRHIGLDPDEQLIPVEQLALERMKHGGFRSQNLLDDALTIAICETRVAVRAFDADRVDAPLGLRPSAEPEVLEGRPGPLPRGTLVIADQVRPVALLFGATAAGRGVDKRTRRTLLCAVGVRGVPEMALEEALWMAGEILVSAGS